MATEKQFGAVFKESYESFVNGIVKEAERRHGPITAGDVLAAERILESLNSNGGAQRNLKSSLSDPLHIRPAAPSASRVKKSWTHSGIVTPLKTTVDDEEVVPCTQYPSAAEAEADKENIIPETPYLRKQFLKGRISPEAYTTTTPFSMAQRTQNLILQTPVSASHHRAPLQSSAVNHAVQSTTMCASLHSSRRPPVENTSLTAGCPPTLPRHDDDEDDEGDEDDDVDSNLQYGNHHNHYKPSTILPPSSSSLSPMDEEEGELAYITRRMSFSRTTNGDTNNIRTPLISLHLSSPSPASPMLQTPPSNNNSNSNSNSNNNNSTLTSTNTKANANGDAGQVRSNSSTPLVSLLYSPSTPSLTGSQASNMKISYPNHPHTATPSFTATPYPATGPSSLSFMSPILIKAEDIKKLRTVNFSK